MPATNAHALISSYYRAFNARDRRALLAMLSADVVHDINQGEREVGREAFTAFFARMDRCYQEQLTDIRILVSDDGTHAAAEYLVHGTYVATDEGLPPARGQTYILPGGAFFDLHDGLITRVTNTYNLQAWIAQISA